MPLGKISNCITRIGFEIFLEKNIEKQDFSGLQKGIYILEIK
jgi:hypothetical protein